MSDKFSLPLKKSVVFWPVGTGDSTTVILKPEKMMMQIDIRHLEKADDPNEPEWPIIDHLVKLLPKKEGRPYLALFVLTHPDKDHIQGFEELLKKVHIGEIWHTPKIFRTVSDQETLCDDAKAFRKEVHRRRKEILNKSGQVVSGNRIRIIGYDDILKEDNYKDLPEEFKSRPGEIVTIVDGIDLSKDFRAFIHAPFKDDSEQDKNATSLSLNVVLFENETYGQFFFFGDREYFTIKRIFETTEKVNKNTGYLCWDTMLCSHHCSKAVMYAKDEGDQEEKFKKDIMDYFEKYNRNNNGYIVSSSHSAFTDGEGDNPPHKKARKQYESIVKAGRFLCTHEFPTKKEPNPIVFTVVEGKGVVLQESRKVETAPEILASVVQNARGSEKPPSVQVGFGDTK